MRDVGEAMRTVDLLRQLQELDTRTDATRVTIAQLRAQLGDRRALDQREAEVARLRGELQALETQQRDLELQAEDRRAKIAADEGKLYSGRVTSPKELSNLQDEVAQERRQLGTIEDRLLEVLVRVEELRTDLDQREAALAREARAWAVAQETARTRLAGSEAAVADAEAQRQELLAALAPAARATYLTLLRQKGGLAVAPVHQRTCQACRVGLTPAQEQRARIGTDLVTCHSCGRILYVPLT